MTCFSYCNLFWMSDIPIFESYLFHTPFVFFVVVFALNLKMLALVPAFSPRDKKLVDIRLYLRIASSRSCNRIRSTI